MRQVQYIVMFLYLFLILPERVHDDLEKRRLIEHKFSVVSEPLLLEPASVRKHRYLPYERHFADRTWEKLVRPEGSLFGVLGGVA